jgi:hypothetical protein
MNSDEQKSAQEFLNAIATYQYIREDGRLLLEPFCVYLSHCFAFDGILEQSPQPRDMYVLLLEMIKNQLGADSAQSYIQHQNIADWTPDMAGIYPEKMATCVHPSALVSVSHEWIYEIGHNLMRIPEPETPSKYYDWVKEEWVAVYSFINGYHNALNSFQKDFDRKGIQDRGYSLFESLHLAKRQGIDFDAAVEILTTRHDSYQSAVLRVREAIQDGYFLEAVTLEECLISNCLFNYLVNTGTTLQNPSFKILLTAILKNTQKLDESTTSLFKKLDSWRVARNKAIHGFITAKSDSMSHSRRSFQRLAETTAKDGEALCETVVSWYEIECVNFIPHQFPAKTIVN